MTFDLATAAFFSSLVEVALSIGMFALWGRDKNHYLLFWSLGFFFIWCRFFAHHFARPNTRYFLNSFGKYLYFFKLSIVLHRN